MSDLPKLTPGAVITGRDLSGADFDEKWLATSHGDPMPGPRST